MDRNLSISNQGRVGAASLSARRAWIEIDGFGVILTAVGSSLSARRAWIEINVHLTVAAHVGSLSARRAWIEIISSCVGISGASVALRKESVDRNSFCHSSSCGA